jgi:hypothetical protein
MTAVIGLGVGLVVVVLALFAVRARTQRQVAGESADDATRGVVKLVRKGDWLCERNQYGEAVAAYREALGLNPAGKGARNLKARVRQAEAALTRQVNHLHSEGGRLAARWSDASARRLEGVGDPAIASRVIESARERGAVKVPCDYAFDDVWKDIATRMADLAIRAPEWTPKKAGGATLDYAVHCIVDELVTNSRGKGEGELVVAWDMPGGWFRIVDQREWFDFEGVVDAAFQARRDKADKKKITRTGGAGMGLQLVHLLAERFGMEVRHRYLKKFKIGNEFTLVCPKN